jgi:hypothetical protein
MNVKKRSVIAQMVNLAVACFLVLLAGVTAWAQPTATQTINLQSGWNAVFLEVAPPDATPAKVFAGMPVESVWTFMDRSSQMDYLKNPSEGLWGQPGWYVYSPAKANLTNLFAITANRAYLIKMTAPYSWNVSGAPSMRAIHWVPDSFNFTGFHIDDGAAPSFATFFAPSSAQSGQAYYRLNGTGTWSFINNPATSNLKQGEAYWIYSVGGSSYQGPLAIDTGSRSGLVYGSDLGQITVTLTNLASAGRSVTLQMLPSGNPVPLEMSDYNNTTSLTDYTPLPVIVTLAAGESRMVPLNVRRSAMAAGTAESVLKISDGAGMRLLIPVSATK